jgi:hypothetical protein
MKTLSLRILSPLLCVLCASVAACGGSTFTALDGDGGSKSGSGSGSSGGGGGGSSSSSGSGSSSGGSSSSGGGGGSGSSGSGGSGSSSSSSGSSGGSGGSSSSSSSGSSSGGGIDAGPGTFACGPALTCDGRTHYCNLTEGGATTPDGGTNRSYSCIAIPLKCLTNPTCACIATGGEQCSESSGDVTVTQQAP